jgi:leader peptidase (prepilin peptidase)/N-methyltransferase
MSIIDVVLSQWRDDRTQRRGGFGTDHGGVMDGWLLILVSPFIGSLLGTLILRLPEGRPVLIARSACASCGARLGARDLVPLLSYVCLAGRCRRCHQPIGVFHPLVELAAFAVALSVVLVEPLPARLWVDAGLGWALLTLAWIDARTLWLPDALILPLLAGGLGVIFWQEPADVLAHAAAAGLGYGVFVTIAAMHRRLRGIDGLGGGDAKLLGVAGAWLGLDPLPWVATLAALACLVSIMVMPAADRGVARQYPFGPYLAGAIWVLFLISVA